MLLRGIGRMHHCVIHSRYKPHANNESQCYIGREALERVRFVVAIQSQFRRKKFGAARVANRLQVSVGGISIHHVPVGIVAPVDPR